MIKQRKKNIKRKKVYEKDNCGELAECEEPWQGWASNSPKGPHENGNISDSQTNVTDLKSSNLVTSTPQMLQVF